MTSSSKARPSIFRKAALTVRVGLLFSFLVLNFDAAIAQQPNTRYISEEDVKIRAKAGEQAKLIEKLDAMRGTTLWYQPKPGAASKIKFLEPGQGGTSPAYRIVKQFVVETETSFTVIGYDHDKYDQYYLKLEFLDGKIGYLGVNLLASISPDKYSVIENLYPGMESARDFHEYLFLRPPQEIFAAENREAAERNAKQARADAEWKSRGGVKIGMTTAKVLSSNWGKPSKINRTVTRNGKHEQWVYDGNNYLYFENGKLTAIQN